MIKPPPLRNDCFAMPQGVDWTPVDTALDRLREALRVVVGHETVALQQAGGRILAADVIAKVGNPPFPNSAVDGYGFSFGDVQGDDIIHLPLQVGVAAAGSTNTPDLETGKAIRILTGARLPVGVDTVVLEEDVNTSAGEVVFHAGLKAGANTRKASEDFGAGDVILTTGRHLRPQDLGLIAASGNTEVLVYERLKVAVLSTGNEITQSGNERDAHGIFDANRPMLLDLVRQWGCEAVDLGRADDDAAVIRAKLDHGAQTADVILTTGGASAGDEDHISRLLKSEAHLQTWRIAIKPGRPLALAMWQGTPVFGLPGNPVAAFVCALVFGFPAFAALSGAGWQSPLPRMVPAAFEKNKKPGRREVLRARLNSDGHAEVFNSEGSGRISGLSWAEGLVELGDAGRKVTRGDLVAYRAFTDFRV